MITNFPLKTVRMARLATIAAVVAPALVAAQDPAPGWMGYAKATNPAGGIITKMEAYWTVGGTPQQSGAFFSPWFGIETSDNLNLIQPVNPWMGSSWAAYIEYFREWSPEYNYDSDSANVNSGDLLYGRVTYNAANHSYTIYHSDITTGWSVTSVIDIQRKNGVYKNYTIGYIVYEKSWPCAYYPPEGQVTFTSINIEWDGKPQTPTWTTGYVDDTCNNRAHILNATTVQITWDPNM